MERKLFLFGNPRLEQDSISLEIGRREAMAFLAYLALESQHQSQDELITLFWPESDHEDGLLALRKNLSLLDEFLGHDWSHVDKTLIGLNPDLGMWVDVLRFEGLFSQCQTHNHPEAAVCPECLSPLSAAAALYKGDFMAGFSITGSPAFGQWRLLQKERLERKAANVLARLGEEYGYQGKLTRAVDYYLRWISIDPIDEQANQQLMSLYVRSGQRAAALDLFDAFKRRLAQELGVDPPVAMLDFYTAILAEEGESEDALNHIEEGLALYSPQQHHSDASLFSGHDLGVCAHTMASYALWMLGYPDKALERAKDALRLSQEFNHPSSLALSYEHLAGIHRFRREPEAAEAMALELIRVAKDMGSEYDGATGQVLLGWALVEQGQGEEGLDQIRRGLDQRRPLGTGLEDAHILAVLAEALGEEGPLEEGLLLLEELILTIEETDQRFWKAELHRLKGDLLGRQRLYLDEAERAFRQAITTARRQGAKSLELRALMGLVHLHHEQGREEGYHEQLSQLVEWFTEGFDTPDLRQAKALLAAGVNGAWLGVQ